MMERIFIEKEWCIGYVLYATESILNSANKETTVKDFLNEIEVMFNIHTNNNSMEKNKIDKMKKNLSNTKIIITK